MSEENKTPESNEEPKQEQQVQAPNPFAKDSWVETQPQQETVVEVKTEEAAPAAEEKKEEKKEEEKIPEPSDWLKKEFGWESTDSAKAEIEELRKLKNVSHETKFANERSEKLFNLLKDGKEDEVYEDLDQHRRLKKYTTTEINESNAAEIIKWNMQQKNKELTSDDVEFLYNKKFSIPPKPIQSDNDLEGEYEQKLSEWERQVGLTKREMIIEAKLAKPELEKLKTELVLPDIQKENSGKTAQEQQEELQRLEAARSQFLSSLESDYNKFSGFEAKYKDEEVEIPVSFTVSDEDKAALKEELKTFDVDDFIAKRWFGEKDSKPNIKQIMEDIKLLRERDNIFQKIANEVGTQVLKHYRQKKGNVNVSGTTANSFEGNGEKSNIDKQVEYLWNTKY